MRISRKRFRPQDISAKKYLSNLQIIFPVLRVIDEAGVNLGELKKEEAMKLADERGLDLVVINPKGEPPVAKFVNFGQFKYQKEKEERLKKAQSKSVEVKGIRLTPRIAEHDLQVRIKQAQNFLDRGDKVQIEVIMRGRDKAHPEIIVQNIKRFIDALKSHMSIRIEQDIQRQGTKFIALVAKQ